MHDSVVHHAAVMHPVSCALLLTSPGELSHIEQSERATVSAQDTPLVNLTVVGLQHGVVHVRSLGISVEHMVDKTWQAEPEHVGRRHREWCAEGVGRIGD